MKILAFETATEACSVALYLDGEVRERHEVAPRRHAELALPWAEALLADAGIGKRQLDAIAIGRGPGAFTGVRLAIALAQGIALALDLPIVPVSTLKALAAAVSPVRSGDGREGQPGLPAVAGEACALIAAASAGDGDRVLAAIDARMGEIYVAAFAREGKILRALSDEIVIAPQDYALPDGELRWHGVGTGFAAADGLLAQRLGPSLLSVQPQALPRAADTARLAAVAFKAGEAVSPESVQPAYLRNNVALTLQEQQAQRAARG